MRGKKLAAIGLGSTIVAVLLFIVFIVTGLSAFAYDRMDLIEDIEAEVTQDGSWRFQLEVEVMGQVSVHFKGRSDREIEIAVRIYSQSGHLMESMKGRTPLTAELQVTSPGRLEVELELLDGEADIGDIEILADVPEMGTYVVCCFSLVFILPAALFGMFGFTCTIIALILNKKKGAITSIGKRTRIEGSFMERARSKVEREGWG